MLNIKLACKAIADSKQISFAATEVRKRLFLRQQPASPDGSQVYQGHTKVGAECPFKLRCYQSEKGQAHTINTDNKEALRQDINRKMQTSLAQATYKQRKVIVEPVLG